jgi:uncharacterized membrane protein YphA (DoxX/SURF4 family)
LVALGGAALRALLPVARGFVAVGLVDLVATHRVPPVMLGAAALLAAGVLTRLTAFAAAVVLTFLLDGAMLPLSIYLALLLLLLAGPGRGALWDPERRWLMVRPGDARAG